VKRREFLIGAAAAIPAAVILAEVPSNAPTPPAPRLRLAAPTVTPDEHVFGFATDHCVRCGFSAEAIVDGLAPTCNPGVALNNVSHSWVPMPGTAKVVKELVWAEWNLW